MDKLSAEQERLINFLGEGGNAKTTVNALFSQSTIKSLLIRGLIYADYSNYPGGFFKVVKAKGG